MKGVSYRPLRRDELADCLAGIDRSEERTAHYRTLAPPPTDSAGHHKASGLVRVEADESLPDWDPHHREMLSLSALRCHDNGGVVLGAFADEDGEQEGTAAGPPVGIAAVDGCWLPLDKAPHVVANRHQLPAVELVLLFTSGGPSGVRRSGHGVGSELLSRAAAAAREQGAATLYISATNTVGTVDFYRAKGCRLAPELDFLHDTAADRRSEGETALDAAIDAESAQGGGWAGDCYLEPINLALAL